MLVIIRLIIGSAFLIYAIHSINQSKLKRKRGWIASAVVIFLVITSVTVFFPVENLFVNFKSPESAYKYCTGKSNINLVVEGNTCDLVVSQKDHSYSNLIVPKTEDGWKVGVHTDTRIRSKSISDDINMIVYRYRFTNEYFLLIIDTDGGELIVSDDYNTEFHSYESTVKTNNKRYITCGAYIPNFNSEYSVIVNGERIEIGSMELF